MLKIVLQLLPLLFLSFQISAAPESFNQAKSELREYIYHDRNHAQNMGTLYCGCSWEWTGISGGRIDAKGCGYNVRKQAMRGTRIEYEHILC